MRAKEALDRPSLAEELPNGNIIANDDLNDRVIVIDKATKRIVWQYGTTGRRGAGPDQLHKPRLLSDNGPSYIAEDLAEWIQTQGMSHIHGAPLHPQTQGKIERWHQTLKNRILLENYFLPGDLQAQIEAFVEHYNHRRYHESLDNVTPADAYFGRAAAIIQQRERIKRKTIEHRRLQHRKLAA